jgi:hypothetical protein
VKLRRRPDGASNLAQAARRIGVADKEEGTMSDRLKEAHARAEARFQKQQKAAQEGAAANADREAQARAVEARTAHLRSLRLAKEAADKEAESKRKEAKAQPKAKSGTARRRSP